MINIPILPIQASVKALIKRSVMRWGCNLNPAILVQIFGRFFFCLKINLLLETGIYLQLNNISSKGNSETYGGGKPPIQYATDASKVFHKTKTITRILSLVFICCRSG